MSQALRRLQVPGVACVAASGWVWQCSSDGDGRRGAGQRYPGSAECKVAETALADKPKSRLVFIGTGSSTGLPRPYCLLHPEYKSEGCKTSRLAAGEGPGSKNWRGNPSMLIQYASKCGRGSVKNIQIDVGKTWREGVIQWYPKFGVRRLDAIILSHDHADAVLGLDEVRGLQAPGEPPIPVHLAGQTHRQLRTTFPYLVPADPNQKPGDVGIRQVSALTWHVFKAMQPFEVEGLRVLPIPVLHGEDYVSMGFCFGPEHAKIVYISDVSRVPPETMEVLQRMTIKLLIVDALHVKDPHPTHFSLPETVALVRQLRPQRALLVGMADDFEHHAVNQELAKLKGSADLDMQLAYDGMSVEVQLD